MRRNDPESARRIRIAAILLCLAMAAALLLPAAICAQSSPKTVRVGWFESPFNQTDRFGRRSGYAYEYQRKIAAYVGWEYEYVEGSWLELLDMLGKGEIDLLSDVSYTEKRAESLSFSALPMGSEEYHVFVAVGNTQILPDHTSSLNGKTVGVNQDSVQKDIFEAWEKEHGVQADLRELTCSEEESLKMLREGELDAYITLDTFGKYDVCVPVWKIGSSDFYFALNKDRKDLLEDLDTAMSMIQDQNRYYNIQLYEKYMQSSGANVFLGEKEKAWLSCGPSGQSGLSGRRRRRSGI